MRIRIEGSPDLVMAWKALIERDYKVSGAVYQNNRRNQEDIRCYFNLDDRLAAEIVGLATTGSALEPQDMKPVAPGRGKRLR